MTGVWTDRCVWGGTEFGELVFLERPPRLQALDKWAFYLHFGQDGGAARAKATISSLKGRLYSPYLWQREEGIPSYQCINAGCLSKPGFLPRIPGPLFSC